MKFVLVALIALTGAWSNSTLASDIDTQALKALGGGFFGQYEEGLSSFHIDFSFSEATGRYHYDEMRISHFTGGYLQMTGEDESGNEHLFFFNFLNTGNISVNPNLKYAALDLDVCGWDYVTDEEVCGTFAFEAFSEGKLMADPYLFSGTFGCTEYLFHSDSRRRVAEGLMAFEITNASGTLVSGEALVSGYLRGGTSHDKYKEIPDC